LTSSRENAGSHCGKEIEKRERKRDGRERMEWDNAGAI